MCEWGIDVNAQNASGDTAVHETLQTAVRTLMLIAFHKHTGHLSVLALVYQYLPNLERILKSMTPFTWELFCHLFASDIYRVRFCVTSKRSPAAAHPLASLIATRSIP